MGVNKEIESLVDIHEHGKETLKKLFELDDEKLKKKISDVVSILNTDIQKRIRDILENKPAIRRTILNGDPERMEISSYDSIKIDWVGIWIKSEHHKEHVVLFFAKEFNLI